MITALVPIGYTREAQPNPDMPWYHVTLGSRIQDPPVMSDESVATICFKTWA